MNTDMPVILTWWLVWVLMGFIGWPISSVIFQKWENKGYLLAKAVGVILTSLVVWLLASFKILPFGIISLMVSGLIVFTVGIYLDKNFGNKDKLNYKKIALEELLFFLAFTFWTFIKSHEPSISGLEKFMDYGFTKSILRSEFFPPIDMWFSGETINYYYFGHLIMAVIVKISGVGLDYGFNLMLSTIFGLCLTMSFSIGRKLLDNFNGYKKFIGALFIAILVTISGNLHTIYAFTTGYWGEDNPPAFWQIWPKTINKSTIMNGFDNYWYPNATRFIPYTIHEFPSYSFVVSDLHGHVLSIPIVLTLIALIVELFIVKNDQNKWLKYLLYGVVAGAAFMTNALDGPIYLGLFALLLFVGGWKIFKDNVLLPLIFTCSVFVITTIPFLASFKPFVNGIAVNCPPAALANSKVGPILFESVDKCQKSPIWMLLVLWGFFWYCLIGLYNFSKTNKEIKKTLLWIGMFCTGLILFSEFFYFKDIYPQHFRSNTMFKLGYQAFILLSIISGFTIINIVFGKLKSKIDKLFLITLIPLVFLILIYPYFSVRSYFGGLKTYQGIWGLQFLEDKYGEDFALINWINKHIKGQPVIVEAAGDSYTDYERISTFTGLPTVAGWAVHEWLWRGGYDPIAKRASEVGLIYESEDLSLTRNLLKKYGVKYVIIGGLERLKYPNINEEKFNLLGSVAYQVSETKIIELY